MQVCVCEHWCAGEEGRWAGRGVGPDQVGKGNGDAAMGEEQWYCRESRRKERWHLGELGVEGRVWDGMALGEGEKTRLQVVPALRRRDEIPPDTHIRCLAVCIAG